MVRPFDRLRCAEHSRRRDAAIWFQEQVKNGCLILKSGYNSPEMSDYGSTFRETLRAVGDRARQLRLIRQIRQAELATRAGVGISTVRRFEKTGAASIENVLRIATVLSADSAFEKLFEAPPYASLDEALARPEVTHRQRAPRLR